MRLAQRIEQNWYRPAWHNVWLIPLWLLVVPLVWLKRRLFLWRRRVFNAVPVVVVGNISIGGTGKTPLITALVGRARAQGLNPGIVSRGYGGRSEHYPLLVGADTPVAACGDEPRLLHSRLQCPLAVDPQRRRAVAAVTAAGANLIFSDDGLQHYAMAREAEIVVVDGQRRFGNGWLLPVGPLREPVSRLQDADLVLVNGDDFRVEASALVNARSGERLPLSALHGREVDAVAGIGHPQRFYQTLQGLGAQLREHSFADHHAFTPADFTFSDPTRWLVMTEKDWVKCHAFARPHWWYLQVDAVLTPEAEARVDALLQRLV